MSITLDIDYDIRVSAVNMTEGITPTTKAIYYKIYWLESHQFMIHAMLATEPHTKSKTFRYKKSAEKFYAKMLLIQSIDNEKPR